MIFSLKLTAGSDAEALVAVSYTHLDDEVRWGLNKSREVSESTLSRKAAIVAPGPYNLDQPLSGNQRRTPL